jgi:hypothetical protein
LGDAELLVIEIKGVKVEAVTGKEQFMLSKDMIIALSQQKWHESKCLDNKDRYRCHLSDVWP